MNAWVGFLEELPAHPIEIRDRMEYAWLESPVKSPCLARINDATDWAEIATWPAGRLFGPRGEYRWRRIEGGAAQRLHAVLLVEDEELPAAFQGRLELERLAEEDLILWGKWVDDPASNPRGGPIFYANEIPKLLAYPLEWTGRPKPDETPRLSIRRYRACEEQRGEFVRCVAFHMKGPDTE